MAACGGSASNSDAVTNVHRLTLSTGNDPSSHNTRVLRADRSRLWHDLALMNMSLITERAVVPSAVDDVAASIADLHRRISWLPDLRPSPDANGLFTELVRQVVETPDGLAPAVLGHPDVQTIVPDLRDLASRAETELEFTWARRIAGAVEPEAEIRRFPYVRNYGKLCRVECGLIDAVLDDAPRSVAFVGCGALPVTSLMLGSELGCEVVNIDRDRATLDAAAGVARALGLSDTRFVEADAAAVDLTDFDVVLLAAMVGTTEAEKRAVLSHLRESMRPDAVLLARSARGLRTLLYPPIQDDALAGFDVRAVVHPVSEVINSVVLARPAR